MASLFQQFGLDFDPEAEVRKRRQEGLQNSLKLIEGISGNSGVQGAANIGAMLGAGFSKPQLTPQQEQIVAIQKGTAARAKAWEEANPDASEEDKAFALQDIAATEAVKAGRTDIGSEMFQQVAERKRLRELQKKELEALGYRTRVDKVDAEKAEAGDHITVWHRDETDPNKSFNAVRSPTTGELVDTASGQKLGPGEYTTERPLSGKQLDYDPRSGSGTEDLPDLMDSDGLYNAAVRYAASGWLPGGAGKQAAATRMKIMDWGAKISHDADWAPPEWANERDKHPSYRQAYQAFQNVNATKLAGNPTLATRRSQLEAIPDQIRKLEPFIYELDFPNNPIAAEVKAQWYKQTAGGKKREAWQNYLSRRQDLIFEITGALRSRGNTVQADKAESEAASKYLSPAAFRGWAEAQLAAMESMGSKLNTLTQPRTEFKTLEDAEAANLPKGTKITINGRKATVK